MSQLSRVALVACLSLPLLAACNRKPASPEPAVPAAQKATLNFDQGLAQAKAQQLPLIVDFHAPWCYSCYFMATNILTGADWDAVEKKAVVVEVDADSPDGAALMQKYEIKFLPSYLVLTASGDELGRILGEKTRAEFYPQINKLLDSGETLDAVRAMVVNDSPTSVVAGRSVLKSYLARYDAGAGLQWLTTLPADANKALHDDAAASLTIARLQFLQAAQQHDAKAALSIGAKVLAGDLGCERPYELDRYVEFASQQPDAKTLIAAQRPAAEKLVATGVFGAEPCADKRSAVFAAADIDEAVGDKDAKKALLERAIADVEKDMAGDLKKDRNLDDNLRIYNDQLAELTGNYTAYDALMPRLIAAWPDDYVYAARWGKSLLARGQPALALAQFEKAAEQAYGINRLQVAEQRVKALQALDRGAEAKHVVAEVLKANGPWFPDEAAKLKAMVQA